MVACFATSAAGLTFAADKRWTLCTSTSLESLRCWILASSMQAILLPVPRDLGVKPASANIVKI